MKSKICILVLFCVLLQNCRLVDFLGDHFATPTYSCLWNDLCHVQFNSVQLNLPGTNCEMPFYSSAMAIDYPCTSFYDLVDHIIFYQSDSIQINWNASVSGKDCSVGDSTTAKRCYNRDNFYHEWQYSDYIMEAPLITAGLGINYSDLKHELTIQIFGVTNDYDGSHGHLAWSYNWVGNDFPSFYNSSNNTWYFEFPNGGLKGTYTPDGDYPRQIYVHNQFEFH